MVTAVYTTVSSVSSSNHKLMNCPNTASLSNSTFLLSTKLSAAQPLYKLPWNGNGRSSGLTFKSPRAQKSPYDRIPKQFRQENLKEGLMENYKNVPQSLYGLSPSQMKLFMTADNPFSRQSETITEESISSTTHYSQALMGNSSTTMCSMNTVAFGGGSRPYGRGRLPPPPDLPSLILDCRIVFIGMPLVPAVTELLVAQFMWLNFDDDTKPIFLNIYSTGTLDEKMENVALETDAYAIADSVLLSRAPVYTLNMGMAYGQAAMLLSLGVKGRRSLMPNCSTTLYLPKLHRSSGPVSDMYIRVKDHEVNVDYYLDYLSQGTGKSKEEIAKDLERPRYFSPEAAVEYGIADRILDPNRSNRGNYDEPAPSHGGSRIGGSKPRLASPGFLFR